LDVYATEQEYVVRANLPGVKPDETEITIEGDTLNIRAKLPERLENVEYALRERDSGEYGRTLQFRVPVEPESAEAAFENGVLTLTVPKVEEAQPKRIEVKAN
jgi:HSP20 family protein